MEKASEKKRGLGGQITVFVSMILMLLFAFLCVLMESARTAGARWYLQMAASSSMDSVFSQYHRQLWDRYRLLFAEYETGAEMEADFAGFLLPYLETGAGGRGCDRDGADLPHQDPGCLEAGAGFRIHQ